VRLLGKVTWTEEGPFRLKKWRSFTAVLGWLLTVNCGMPVVRFGCCFSTWCAVSPEEANPLMLLRKQLPHSRLPLINTGSLLPSELLATMNGYVNHRGDDDSRIPPSNLPAPGLTEKCAETLALRSPKYDCSPSSDIRDDDINQRAGRRHANYIMFWVVE